MLLKLIQNEIVVYSLFYYITCLKKMRYNKEKRIFMAKKLINLGSSTLVQRAWRSKYMNVKPPAHSTITNVVSKLEKYGTLNDLPPLQKKLDEKLLDAKNMLKTLFTQNPSLSLRKAACEVGDFVLCN